MKKYDLIIVGGGAAGMFAAFAAFQKKPNAEILLLEQNEKLGKKIYITGKGRCNVTNACDISEYFDNIKTNPEFLYSSLYNFTNIDTMKFFESQHIPLKIERGNRVFPKSDKSSDIIKGLSSSIKNADIHLNERVEKISKYNDFFTVSTSRDKYESSKLIIATGGLSYPTTGSTGDGYIFAKSFGHSIKRTKPSLCPVLLDDNNLAMVTGLTVKNSEISVYIKKKKEISYFGDFLFTHRGISGPIVLTLTDFINDYPDEDIELYCNFKPAVEKNELEERLLKDIDKNPKKELKSILKNYFPESLTNYLLASTNINPKIKMCEITKSLRKEILNLMVSYKFSYKNIAPISQAIITKGGVSTLEINPSTMESKKVNGLYFCGEVIDVNGLTGGYNLQIAFSTGYLAGQAAIEWLKGEILWKLLLTDLQQRGKVLWPKS